MNGGRLTRIAKQFASPVLLGATLATLSLSAVKQCETVSGARSTLRLGVACQSKPTRYFTDNSHKKCDCGEDAFFAVQSEHLTHFGVADGVGGWASLGFDSSKVSWKLMDHAEAIAQSQPIFTPAQVLDHAFQKTTEDKTITGSTTACLARFDSKTGTLLYANLGDSSLVVIRNQQVLLHISTQQHQFNMPKQLLVLSDSYRLKESKRLGAASTWKLDYPKDADTGEITLQVGDVLVMGTDGLFDNLFDEDIIKCVGADAKHLLQHSQINPEEIDKQVNSMANKLVQQAVTYSVSTRQSPFAVAAAIENGGKVDDTTVIVACVLPLEQTPISKL